MNGAIPDEAARPLLMDDSKPKADNDEPDEKDTRGPARTYIARYRCMLPWLRAAYVCLMQGRVYPFNQSDQRVAHAAHEAAVRQSMAAARAVADADSPADYEAARAAAKEAEEKATRKRLRREILDDSLALQRAFGIPERERGLAREGRDAYVSLC